MPPVAENGKEPVSEKEEDGSWINNEFLEDILGEGCTVVSVDAQRAVGKGENFLSLLYRTRVEYQPAGSDDTHVRHLMVKGFPNGEFMQIFIEEVGVFQRETRVYEEVFPRLYEFADAKLGQNVFPRFSAQYYETKRPGTLVLEDLKEHEFVMADRRNRLDYAHAKLVIKNLARLHALVATYEQQHPGYFSQFDDRMFNENNRERLVQFIPPQIKSIAEEIKKWEGFEKISCKLEALVSSAVDRIIDICKGVEGRRKLLVHGDCWVNNILFKYSENGEPENLRFVDYQLTHEGSPALDLNYFIFSSLRTDVRIQHFDDLLEIYCKTFQQWADNLGYSGPLLSLEEIKEDVHQTLFFGFISVLTTMAIVLADPDDTPDLEGLTNKEVEEGDVRMFDKIYASSGFREAFQNLLPFFDERGILD